VARRFVRERPQIGVRLIDLRQHGNSQNFEPPHTIEAAAADLSELARHLGEEPLAVLGHSFGGKVALMYAREHGETLEQLWLVDSTPDARTPDGSAWHMLQLVRSAPRQFESRDQLVSYLQSNGIPQPTGQWMATNLERSEGGYGWRFDLDAIEQLLQDFFVVDLWSVIEDPPGRLEIHIVKARESSVLTPAAIARVHAAETRTGRVHYHEVAGGHWVNAENPGALQELLVQYLHV